MLYWQSQPFGAASAELFGTKVAQAMTTKPTLSFMNMASSITERLTVATNQPSRHDTGMLVTDTVLKGCCGRFAVEWGVAIAACPTGRNGEQPMKADEPPRTSVVCFLPQADVPWRRSVTVDRHEVALPSEHQKLAAFAPKLSQVGKPALLFVEYDSKVAFKYRHKFGQNAYTFHATRFLPSTVIAECWALIDWSGPIAVPTPVSVRRSVGVR